MQQNTRMLDLVLYKLYSSLGAPIIENMPRTSSRSKRVHKALKKDSPARRLYSFRLPVGLMDALKAYSEKRGSTQTRVVELLLRDLLKMPRQ